MGVQVGQILRQAARRHGDQCALVDLGHEGERRRELTFAQLERMARRAAAQLRAAGIERGDRVALMAENQAELVAVWFGCAYAGAAVVPINVLASASELAERGAHSGAKLVVHDAARSAVVQRALEAMPTQTAQARALSQFDWQAGDELAYPVDCLPSDTALVLYTSGTTGKPKGAAISHTSLLLHTMLLVQHALGLTPADRVLCPLPLSHSYGCRLGLLAPFYAGARVVVVPRFDAERSLRALHDEQISWLPAVPTMFAAWGQLRAAAPPARLKWALCAGAPLGLAVAERAEARLGAPVRQGYGMTEATFCTIDAPPDERTPGSVGRPIWGIELRVVDDAGRDLPTGQSGEVLVRGHNVMTHYLFDADATQEVAPDGWVRSGDVGRLDEHGRLYIVDRIKDLIIRGGYNIYPSELESALGAHPAVGAVAVIGEPDEYYGERVLAVVVAASEPPPTAAELQAFAAAKLSRIKLPQAYAFVSELPLGASGKVEKRRLREQLASGQLQLENVAADKAGKVVR